VPLNLIRISFDFVAASSSRHQLGSSGSLEDWVSGAGDFFVGDVELFGGLTDFAGGSIALLQPEHPVA
jgi:hypothetical protein